jgi:hypothetical protein
VLQQRQHVIGRAALDCAHQRAGVERGIERVTGHQVIGPSGASVAVCTVAPAACAARRSGVLAIGMDVELPAPTRVASRPS